MATEITFMTSSGYKFSIHTSEFTTSGAIDRIIARMDSQRALSIETAEGIVIVNTCSIVTASAKDAPAT